MVCILTRSLLKMKKVDLQRKRRRKKKSKKQKVFSDFFDYVSILINPPTHYVSKCKHLNKLTHPLFWLRNIWMVPYPNSCEFSLQKSLEIFDKQYWRYSDPKACNGYITFKNWRKFRWKNRPKTAENRPKKSAEKKKQKETNFIGTKVTQKLKNSKKDKMQKKPGRNLGS